MIDLSTLNKIVYTRLYNHSDYQIGIRLCCNKICNKIHKNNGYSEIIVRDNEYWNNCV